MPEIASRVDNRFLRGVVRSEGKDSGLILLLDLDRLLPDENRDDEDEPGESAAEIEAEAESAAPA